MGRAVGGGSAVGCGVFGLVGILLSVGIVAWLGSQAMSGVDDAASKAKATTTTTIAAPGLPTGSEAGRILVLEAPGPVDSGVVVAVGGTGFTPGPIEVTSCLRALPTGAQAPRCDPTSTAVATVDAQSRFTVRYPVKRVIEVDGTQYDCGAFIGACSLVARTKDAPELVLASAAITFADGLDPVGGERPPTP